MNAKIFLTLLITLISIVILSTGVFLSTNNIALLNPKGPIAQQQFELLRFAVALSLVVLVPVFTLTFFIAWRYRAKNTEARQTVDTNKNSLPAVILWLIPAAIIFILAQVTWQATHKLDPYKPLSSSKPPMTIQVVALQWKWLFIYPDQDIATVNFVQFPEQTPIRFKLTADAPMNSFWIPQLSGQIYAMPGMETELNVMANEKGEFSGSAAEISGTGFAGMRFVAKASSESDFETWVENVQESEKILTVDEYDKLAKPSENNQVSYYSWQEDLFDNILNKYSSSHSTTHQ